MLGDRDTLPGPLQHQHHPAGTTFAHKPFPTCASFSAGSIPVCLFTRVLSPSWSWPLSFLPTADLSYWLCPSFHTLSGTLNPHCAAEPVCLSGGASASRGTLPRRPPFEPLIKMFRAMGPRRRALGQALENSRCPFISCHQRRVPAVVMGASLARVSQQALPLCGRKPSTPASGSPASLWERELGLLHAVSFDPRRADWKVWRGEA